MVRSVAVIGVGAMGAPMARRLLAAGFDVTICDSNLTALAAFSGTNVRVSSVPADCAESDVILIIVSTPHQVRKVILGDGGILSGLTGRSVPILIVLSTVSAEILLDIAQQLPPEIRMVDAPISGGVEGAVSGTLTMLTGGDERDVKSVKPVFDELATHQIHCGELGAAQTMKILNNTLGISIAVLAGEVYRLAIEQGLDPIRVSAVLEACSGRNFRSKDPAGPSKGYAEMTKDRAVFAGLQAIMSKDLGLAVDIVSRSTGEYPAIRGVKALIDTLDEETFDNWRRVAEFASERE